jgi:hypothetical protein
VNDAAAGGERGDGADLMRGDGGAGVPLALERQVRDETDLTAVGEERDRGRRVLRLDARPEQRRTADEAVVFGSDDRDLRRGSIGAGLLRSVEDHRHTEQPRKHENTKPIPFRAFVVSWRPGDRHEPSA